MGRGASDFAAPLIILSLRLYLMKMVNTEISIILRTKVNHVIGVSLNKEDFVLLGFNVFVISLYLYILIYK